MHIDGAMAISMRQMPNQILLFNKQTKNLSNQLCMMTVTENKVMAQQIQSDSDIYYK